MDRRFLCRGCLNVFDYAITGSSVKNPIRCPACDSLDVTEAPPWAPLGSGANIFGGNEWSYECQQCNYEFRMPIPASPEEDKARKCPKCESSHLHLITASKALPLYCG